tara:strand:- start:1677 stop:1859 length:183 start_codon:yes stop_codon:yes gene_type:complete
MIEEYEDMGMNPLTIDVDGDMYFLDECSEDTLTGDVYDDIILDMMANDERFYDEEDDDLI